MQRLARLRRPDDQVVQVMLEHRRGLHVVGQLRPGPGVGQVGEEDAHGRVGLLERCRVLERGPDRELGQLLCLDFGADQVTEPLEGQLRRLRVGQHRQPQESADGSRLASRGGAGRDRRHRALADDPGVSGISHRAEDEVPVGGVADLTGDEGAHRVRLVGGRYVGPDQLLVDQLAHEGGGPLYRLGVESGTPLAVEEVASELGGESHEIGDQSLTLSPGIGVGDLVSLERRHLRVPFLECPGRAGEARDPKVAAVVVKALDVEHLRHGEGRAAVGKGVQEVRRQVGAGRVVEMWADGQQLVGGRQLRDPDLVDGDHVVGSGPAQAGGEDAFVEVAVVRGLDADEDAALVTRAELRGQRL